MKRKVLAAFLCVAMAATMATGCGSKAADSNQTDDAAGYDAAGGDDAGSGEGGVVTIGFAQVGHESDWRTASTKSCQDVFSEANGVLHQEL